MAEFTYNSVQLIDTGSNAIFNSSICCNRGYIIHRNESGVIILRGIVSNPTSFFARYQCTFNGNIAIPEDGTVGAISVALALGGEPIQTSKAIVTPAADSEYFNVTSTAFIDVPRGCCFSIALENTSDQAINLQNANLVVTRTA